MVTQILVVMLNKQLCVIILWIYYNTDAHITPLSRGNGCVLCIAPKITGHVSFRVEETFLFFS